MVEQMFFGFYGSPVVQRLLGINDRTEVRPLPNTSPETLAAQRAQAATYASTLQTGGFDAALTRAVIYVLAADRKLDQRCALALSVARQQVMRLSLAEFKGLVRNQCFLLQRERDSAVEALAVLVPAAEARKDLLTQVRAIVGAAGPPSAAERDRLARLSQALAVPIEQPVMTAPPARTAAASKPDAVLH
jgi:hypothetical protein